MKVFFEQYFDFHIMGEHFGEVFEAFLQNLLIFVVAAVVALDLGPGPRPAPAAAGQETRPAPLPHDRLHRRPAGGPAADHHPDDLRRRPLPHLPAERHPHPRTGSGKPDPFWYGVAGLVFVYGAYTAEVYRAGIEAVPKGQMEAARSLGMSHLQAMRHIIVPQAVTKIPAPMLNELISLLKDTTLVSVIAFGESVLVSREILAEHLNSSALTLDRSLLPRHLPARRAAGRLTDQAQPGQSSPAASHIEVA